MKNFSIKNCVFLLTFYLATTFIHPSSDCDNEYDTYCAVRSTTKFKSNAQWKILIEKECAYFITNKSLVEITICEGKPIVRTKKEESCTPFSSGDKQINAAIALIKEVHVARNTDMTSFIKELERGYTKCNCGTRHK